MFNKIKAQNSPLNCIFLSLSAQTYKNLYEMNANTNAVLKPAKISYKDERNPIIRENNLIIWGKLKVYDVGALLWYSKQSSLEPALDINHDVKARNGDVIGYVGKPVGTAA